MSQTVPWKRIFVEGTAIVASILLAFAIDAWWEQRGADAKARLLVGGMRADFEASQVQLTDRFLIVNNIYAANTRFLELVQTSDVGSEISVPFGVLVGTLGAPTYSPTDSTLQTAMASGDIDLIDDYELMNAIALWQQQMADTIEDEVLIRELVVTQLTPELSKQVRLGEAFDFEQLLAINRRGPDSISGDPVSLRVTSELEGLLAQRLFYLNFVVIGFTGIQQTQVEILELLETD